MAFSKKVLLGIIFVFLVCRFDLSAQRRKSTFDAGVFLGGSYYLGELNPSKQFYLTKPALGLVLRYNRSKRWAFRFNALFGSVQGDDSRSNDLFMFQRNLNFKSKINEFSLQTEFNFLDYMLGKPKMNFTPYLFAGIGLFKFSPLAKQNDEWIALYDLTTEGQETTQFPDKKQYKLLQITIPFGVGIKLNLAKNIAMSFEWGIRKTFTDYIDDVSGNYPNLKILTRDRGGQARALSDRSLTSTKANNSGRQRGDAFNKDWYSFVGLILHFKLPGQAEPCYASY